MLGMRSKRQVATGDVTGRYALVDFAASCREARFYSDLAVAATVRGRTLMGDLNDGI